MIFYKFYNDKKITMKNNFSITINSKTLEGVDVNNIADVLHQFKEVEYRDIYISWDNDTSLMILMNKTKSLCTFWEDIEEGISYHSINKDGKKDVYELFILSNGQADEVEDLYLVENIKIDKMIEYYIVHGKRPENILWEKD
jgi:hypothetical protein